ncbi:MAG TPA: hypothetical protein PKY82_28490 [Pyrinomonadaceae bacterium]|nr:hypothetical protein [Pyrinomonadaceae bacterium]
MNTQTTTATNPVTAAYSQLGKKRGPYEDLSTQLSLFEETKVESLTDDQVKFRLNDMALREGKIRHFSFEQSNEFYSSCALAKLKAVAEDDYIDDINLQGALEESGINVDAMIDRLKRIFPQDKPVIAFKKFCSQVVGNLKADFNTEEGEQVRVLSKKITQRIREHLCLVEVIQKEQTNGVLPKINVLIKPSTDPNVEVVIKQLQLPDKISQIFVSALFRSLFQSEITKYLTGIEEFFDCIQTNGLSRNEAFNKYLLKISA